MMQGYKCQQMKRLALLLVVFYTVIEIFSAHCSAQTYDVTVHQGLPQGVSPVYGEALAKEQLGYQRAAQERQEKAAEDAHQAAEAQQKLAELEIEKKQLENELLKQKLQPGCNQNGNDVNRQIGENNADKRETQILKKESTQFIDPLPNYQSGKDQYSRALDAPARGMPETQVYATLAPIYDEMVEKNYFTDALPKKDILNRGLVVWEYATSTNDGGDYARIRGKELLIEAKKAP